MFITVRVSYDFALFLGWKSKSPHFRNVYHINLVQANKSPTNLVCGKSSVIKHWKRQLLCIVNNVIIEF